MNILITGANGQLGRAIRQVACCSQDNFIFSDINQVEGLDTLYLDITNLDSIRSFVKDHNINAVVNCAAWTNVDACERDAELASIAKILNADAPQFLATAMKEVDGWLIQLSTDYVFGKEKNNIPLRPDQEGAPLGVYGHTKLQGEQNIKSVGCKYIIIRTAWLYSEFGNNFCKTMLNLTHTKTLINVVCDQCGTPTYALDLAHAILLILQRPQSGIYHYTNEGVTTWFDFAFMIAKIAGNHCNIQPCFSSDYPSVVTRPAYSVLDKTSIKQTFGLSIPYWLDSLEKCINNIKDSTTQS